MFVIVSVLVLLFFLLTIWTIVSAVIVAVIVLPVQVIEPSGPLFRVQLDGQPVVPAALGKVMLVEFANVATSVSACLRFQDICSRLTRIWDRGRYTERHIYNEITNKSKKEEIEQHGEFRLAVTTVCAPQSQLYKNQKFLGLTTATRLRLSLPYEHVLDASSQLTTRIIRVRMLHML